MSKKTKALNKAKKKAQKPVVLVAKEVLQELRDCQYTTPNEQVNQQAYLLGMDPNGCVAALEPLKNGVTGCTFKSIPNKELTRAYVALADKGLIASGIAYVITPHLQREYELYEEQVQEHPDEYPIGFLIDRGTSLARQIEDAWARITYANPETITLTVCGQQIHAAKLVNDSEGMCALKIVKLSIIDY